ncbi:MAG: hypothetical protein KGM98_15940 [Bacteroidota bacterium]|nr:hypothetical protein [Bacteroidota bacterium]
MTAARTYWSTRESMVVRVIAVSWIVAKVMTWKLWNTDRIFPLAPVMDFLTSPAWFQLGLYIIALATLALLVALPANRSFLILLILVEILSCLFDQNRWQPWEFEYLMMMAAIWLNRRDKKSGLELTGWIMVSVYFFSGIQKMGPTFDLGVMGFIKSHFGPGQQGRILDGVINHCGYVLGGIETLSSLFLLNGYLRRFGVSLLIAMHFIIIALFGPWGLHYDLIILPWNGAFAGLGWVLFWKKPSPNPTLAPFRKGRNLLFAFLLMICPILNFFGKWDYFLSSALFSFKTPELFIYVHEETTPHALVPFYIHTQKPSGENLDTFINVRTWAFRELGVPAYPQKRIYLQIQKELSRRYPKLKAVYLMRIHRSGKTLTVNLP